MTPFPSSRKTMNATNGAAEESDTMLEFPTPTQASPEELRRPDTLTELLGAAIQHGPLNRRIYLMSMNNAPAEPLIDAMEKLALQNGYTKIFAKVEASRADSFVRAGYRTEAEIPGFYRGEADAAFVCKYFDDERSRDPGLAAVANIVHEAEANRESAASRPAPSTEGIAIRRCTPEDTPAMATLYRTVFASYPFPIDDPDYLLSTMKSHVIYYCIEQDGSIVALSSAETDAKSNTAEMTDFATDPDFRGRGAARLLLSTMEEEMRRTDTRCLYTISRGRSVPVNRLFGSAGYDFGGILINNTHIGGQLESMTVWHKRI